MRRPLMMACILLSATPGLAAELTVSVTNIRSAEGRIGCLLFNAERGFPGDPTAALLLRSQPAATAGVRCRFEGIAPGTYAVAVSHDANGNGRTDTNMFGIPTEDWGVSNNIRPTMRAPRFEESAVTVAEGPPRGIEIRLGR
ncbi:DUF2141 domain-containing protein [Falsiroseomonas ponticola]|jgi:uncharacterized protein (DUF2141 family)|uniref:DUF2141 domain-containing protein n=1 Tax=Falsiroseomonas ponticola TaxID=2786951 RepID=UPI001934AC22|nr:DUF2141 domain-containing protein [Roseomonas ponticola]